MPRVAVRGRCAAGRPLSPDVRERLSCVPSREGSAASACPRVAPSRSAGRRARSSPHELARGYSRSQPPRLNERERMTPPAPRGRREGLRRPAITSAVRWCACAGGAKMQRVQKKRDNICLHIS